MTTKATATQARLLASKAEEAHARAMNALRAWQKAQDAHASAKHIACMGLPTYAPMKEAAAAYKAASLELQAAQRAAKKARQVTA